jgi:hypothetical protein
MILLKTYDDGVLLLDTPVYSRGNTAVEHNEHKHWMGVLAGSSWFRLGIWSYLSPWLGQEMDMQRFFLVLNLVCTPVGLSIAAP